MDKFNRAIRRHHIARLKRKRQFYWGFPQQRQDHLPPEPMSPKCLGQIVQHPQACSCFGCGNARRHFGYRTVQELRLFQSLLWDETHCLKE